MHRSCKSNALRFLCNQFEIPIENSIVVGDADDCIGTLAGNVLSVDSSDDSLAHVLMAF
jgi:hypothetical protein